jgi:hypothetical protein
MAVILLDIDNFKLKNVLFKINKFKHNNLQIYWHRLLI